MNMSRRTLMSAAVAAGAAGVLSSRAAAAAEKALGEGVVETVPFVEPTKARPIVASFNENPLGLSLKARKAVADSIRVMNRYPFVKAEVLRKACADFIGGKPEEIALSQGSAEAIRASIEAHKAPNVQLVIPELTYSDGEMAAVRNGIPVVKVRMAADWSIDIDGMKKAVADHKGPSIVYFVNPNNPTGSIADSKKLADWIRSKPVDTVFLLDEAYAEYVVDRSYVSMKTLVKEGLDNVIVLKTFSKLFAMAGLRLGFAYACPALVKKVREHIAYDIFMNVPAIEAALSELNDPEFLKVSREMNDAARDIIEKTLDDLKIKYLPSQTNFIFFELKGPLKPFADRMAAENILVGRPFPPADTWCRLSFTRPDDMVYIVKKLKEFREKGWI